MISWELLHTYLYYQESVTGSVIQASRMVTFVDVLMTDAVAADTWLTCTISANPVVHLAALTLGNLVRRAICHIEMDLISSASYKQYQKAM